MITSGRNAIVLSTGAVLMTTSLTPFMRGELNERLGSTAAAMPVFDGLVWDDGAGQPRALTLAEREELARYMARRWAGWASEVQP